MAISLFFLPFLFLLLSFAFAQTNVTKSGTGTIYSYSTNVTRRVTFDVTSGFIAPDGFNRSAILVNGTSPGPDLILDEGDWIEIIVNNEAGEDIAIHWHGIEQHGTPWSDGVAGVTQFPIRTGSSFVYIWKATQSGFYWYHDHDRGLLSDGLRGSILIRPRPGRPNPFALIPGASEEQLLRAEKDSRNLMIHDWSHVPSDRIMTRWNETKIEPLCMQSILINGKGQQVCPSDDVLDSYNAPPRNVGGNLTRQGCASPFNTAIYTSPAVEPDLVDPETFYNCNTTSVTPLENVVVDSKSEWVALQLLNGGSNWNVIISIDEHPMWVVAVDGSYITPVRVDGIDIAMGERYAVFVKLDKAAGSSYNIRAAANVLPQVLTGYALLSYEPTTPKRDHKKHRGTKTNSTVSPPTATASSLASIAYGGEPLDPSNYTLFNASYHPPYPSNPPPLGEANVTIQLDLSLQSATVWVMNRQPWKTLDTPILFDPSTPVGSNLSFAYESNDVVDLVMTVEAGQPSHPVHKHGVKGWIVGQGTGSFNWTSVAEAAVAVPDFFNFVDPPFRDNFNTLSGEAAWTVVRFVSNDPSPTFIHCHISLHLSAGMTVVLLESMNNLPPIPDRYLQYAEEYSGRSFNSSLSDLAECPP
ncbi:Cupredoxin [Mrakia frigida]|uniref:Cupredoxin n=1 Tax=Mrakia frigida TaxID=29902 RepID=UPI003FCC02AD